jgi:low temperature requirement protein LtrA
VGTLLATGVAFFMAVALPQAFHGREMWFAVTYVLVRAIGLILFSLVGADDPAHRADVRNWTLLSLGGLIAVLVGGFLGGTVQYLLWGTAVLLDVIAANIAGRGQGVDLNPDHFGERHGLFVIIALGETLIVAAGRVTGATWDAVLITVAIFAVGITCGLWWSYFARAKSVLDEALEEISGSERLKMAGDVFSLAHFPMLFGVILYAYAIEEVAAHPQEVLSLPVRIALAVGLAIFIGGMAYAVRRATGKMLLPRLVLIVLMGLALILIPNVSGLATLAVAFGGVLAIAIVEQRGEQLTVNNHQATINNKRN